MNYDNNKDKDFGENSVGEARKVTDDATSDSVGVPVSNTWSAATGNLLGSLWRWRFRVKHAPLFLDT